MISANPSLTVCNRCSKIDFQAVFKLRVRSCRGILVRPVGPSVRNWEFVACPLCKLISSLQPKASKEAKFELRAFSSTFVYGFGRRDVKNGRVPPGLQSSVLLGVVEANESDLRQSWAQTGFAALDTSTETQPSPTFSARGIEVNWIDFSLIGQWIRYCRTHHGKRCQLPSSTYPRNLWLIDCFERKLALAEEDTNYAALSYVWGRPLPSSFDFTSKVFVEQFLRTIEDALRATTLVGLRYLWVDRYCIPQDHEEERHIQISQMDSVYSHAEVTIIAAAGDDPTFGLPGMGHALRELQVSARTPTGMLRSTLPDGKFAIEEASWNARGWTDQKAILSRRRLVFTKYQVYFQCNGMHCCESISKPLQILHTKNQRRMRAWNGDGPFKAGGVGAYPWHVLDRIAEFSGRHLSYESDALNAMLGILNAFRTMKYPVFHHFGVPFLPPVLNTQKIGVAFGKLISLVPLPSNSDHSLATGLCWLVREPSKRRIGFPSWSWTGWTGSMWQFSDDRFQYYDGFPEGHLDVKIWIEHRDGTRARCPTDGSKIQIDRFLHSPFLHIEINTLQIKLTRSKSTVTSNIAHSTIAEPNRDSTMLDATMLAKDNQGTQISLSCPFYPTRKFEGQLNLELRLHTMTWTGLLLGRNYLEPKNMRSRGAFVMVVERFGEFWERIGHLNLVDIELSWQYSARQLHLCVKRDTIKLG